MHTNAVEAQGPVTVLDEVETPEVAVVHEHPGARPDHHDDHHDPQDPHDRHDPNEPHDHHDHHDHPHENQADHHRYVPPLEMGDPGPRALRRLRNGARAAFIPDRSRKPVEVVEAPNPLPNGSFGYVGLFFEVRSDAARFRGGTLIIKLDKERLGTVSEETLRVFKWDRAVGIYELILCSGLGQTRDYVYAEIEMAGTYAVIGVNADPRAAVTVDLLRQMHDWVGAAGPENGRRLQKRICELILCSPEMRQMMGDPAFAQTVTESNLQKGLPGLWREGIQPEPAPNLCDTCVSLPLETAAVGIDYRLPEWDLIRPIDRRPVIGQWRVQARNSQILAVHAAMLRTGKVLYFGGDEHDPGQNASGNTDHSRLWDPVTGNITVISSPANHDLFCCGHAFRSNGRLLCAGGTKTWANAGAGIHHVHFKGLRKATLYSPMSNAWFNTGNMIPEPGRTTGGGRWYPTLVTLPDNRIFAMSGHPIENDTRHNNNSLETYNPISGTWSHVGTKLDAPDSYPRLHVLPDGQVFCATPMSGFSQKWNPTTGIWTNVAPGPGPDYGGFDTNTVLLPLQPANGYRARVLAVGGPQARRIDLGSASPTWTNTGARALPGSPRRRNCCSVLLPDGTVFVEGGSRSNNDVDAVRTAELYDPATNSWSVLATAAVPRLYHSVALLLPDGRVWTAGSNFNCSSGLANRELRMELYSPPYLFWGPRPVMYSSPSEINPGTNFNISCSRPWRIDRAVMIRCGSVTHAFDSDQRFIELQILSRTFSRIRVAGPPNRNIAPPGWYMLFILNHCGVPSMARFIRMRP